jgi:hypothetical protein
MSLQLIRELNARLLKAGAAAAQLDDIGSQDRHLLILVDFLENEGFKFIRRREAREPRSAIL